MLDINDIFNYESNTEGTGNFTSFEVDRNGMVTDQIQDNPQGANRIRGIGAANIAVDNFANSGRVPLDPINIDAVEISRGPNSNIFGLGEGSGTVNMVSSTANFNRATSVAEVRFDDLGGWRTSLDLNRPRCAENWPWRERRLPAGSDQRRRASKPALNLMVRFQPFKNTAARRLPTYRGVGTRATPSPRATPFILKSSAVRRGPVDRP